MFLEDERESALAIELPLNRDYEFILSRAGVVIRVTRQVNLASYPGLNRDHCTVGG